MLETNEIKRMLDDCKMFLEMLQYKRLEETRRIGSNLAEKSFCDFKIFSGLSENSKLKEAYVNMEKNYIFAEKDTLVFDFIIRQWERVRNVLLKIN